MSKTWFVTGAARGLGAEIVKAALAAGCNVVATGRTAESVATAFAADDRLLTLALDVTDPAAATVAVEQAVARFGAIDVLVNNAGYGQFGPFEQNTPANVEAVFATNVFGLFNVTRAVLPVMRRQRSGHVFNMSSIAGLRGAPGGALYAATKHAVEGFSESLSGELAGFGVQVTVVEPGFFRTDFLDGSSVRFGDNVIADYADLAKAQRDGYADRNRKQAGDPVKLAQVLVDVAAMAKPPLRLPLGTDAVQIMTTKIETLQAQLAAVRALAESTDIAE